MMRTSTYLLIVLAIVAAGCAAPVQAAQSSAKTGAAPLELAQAASKVITLTAPQASPTPARPIASPTAGPTPVKTSTASAISASGPAVYPTGVSPLTGLPVEDPANLKSPPALVSITNFPITARPQAGLSYSPVVHELYIGEGTTRFLAMFYGDFPDATSAQGESGVVTANAEIGPVRSGRLPYEHLRKLYNGFLVMASADPSVGATLNETTNIFGSQSGDINSAMVDVNRLEQIAQNAQKQTGAVDLQGLSFDPAAPAGGQAARVLWVPYALLDQVIWRYDAASGSYQRYQDQADGATFVRATDRLNGEALTYENVVVLFATHHAYAETLIDVDLLGIKKAPALLFRDGKVYNIFWTTANGEYERTTGKLRPIRFIDEAGNPFPLKPGQTWIHIMPGYSPVYETVDSENYYDKVQSKATPGSGNWAVRFVPPAIEERPAGQ